jgi:hypothetical protein
MLPLTARSVDRRLFDFVVAFRALSLSRRTSYSCYVFCTITLYGDSSLLHQLVEKLVSSHFPQCFVALVI